MLIYVSTSGLACLSFDSVPGHQIRKARYVTVEGFFLWASAHWVGLVRFGSTSCRSKPQPRLPSETAFVFTKSTALSASPFAFSLAFVQPSYNLLGGFDLSPARTSAIASDS